jgi:phosphoribosylaminoimidazole-succinocarboxamide synthase
MKAIYKTNLEGLKLIKRGKVRDIYAAGDKLLIVSTDRVSAFDCVFPDPIPMKGIVLNQLSLYWFEKTRHIVKNHVVCSQVEDFPKEAQKHKGILNGRSVLVMKSKPLPVECVVRGYLHGSAWKEYRDKGSVCGIFLAKGMQQKDILPETLFTPSTKAEKGHDENITFDKVKDMVGTDTANFIRTKSLELYRFGHHLLLSKGLILVDTKFEFGLQNHQIILIDECMTPDSSRIYLAETYKPGMESENYDKQFLRDYLETTGWDKTPPAPPLPRGIIRGTSERYLQAYKIITGKELKP